MFGKGFVVRLHPISGRVRLDGLSRATVKLATVPVQHRRVDDVAIRGLADQDRGWGIPLLLPVMKDTFYLQLMKKAQEAILLEHIVPLRVIFPQPGSGTSDPYTSINLADWRDQVGRELARWRYDNNYIPIFPLPLGNQTIGGDGKALLLTGEMREHCDGILAGMGVPREFVYGGLSYAGTNLSMRMMENFFIDYIGRHRDLLNFVIREISSFLEWKKCDARFKPFKMADDIQRKAYLLQLNQAQKVSDTTLLADADLDQQKESEMMISESTIRVEAMKKQQLALAAKWQTKAQQVQQAAMMAPQAPGEPGSPETAGAAGTPGGQDAEPTTPPGAQAAPQPGAPQQQQPNFVDQVQSQLAGNQKLSTGDNPLSVGGMDIGQMALAQAKLIQQMSPNLQEMAVQNLRAMMGDQLADLVSQLLKKLAKDTQVASPTGIDDRPLPEQRAPRRALASV